MPLDQSQTQTAPSPFPEGFLPLIKPKEGTDPACDQLTTLGVKKCKTVTTTKSSISPLVILYFILGLSWTKKKLCFGVLAFIKYALVFHNTAAQGLLREATP